MNKPIHFPEDFIWGAATAGHQIEGNNLNSDWWARENASDSKVSERSGDAADSYHRFREDIAILAESGLQAYRFSLEWARIEPVEGHFSNAEIAHYSSMVEYCLEIGVQPVVTLNHFTVPLWFSASGGWKNPKAPELFERFTRRVLPILEGRVEYVVTINEPNITAMMAARDEGGDEDLVAGALPKPVPAVAEGLITAHKRAVPVLRSAGIKAGWPVAPQQFFADPGAEDVLKEYAYPREVQFLEASCGDDFIGIQAYTRTRITKDGPVPAPVDAEKTLTGWEYYPPAIAEAVQQAWDVCEIPVFVTENGIATSDDLRRVEYTAEALRALRKVMDGGVPLLGYLHWSLLDNYEWGSYKPTFGLVAFDAETFARTPKPSLAWLGAVARNCGF